MTYKSKLDATADRADLERMRVALIDHLQELQKLVEKACESDRLFFERRPERQHRIRRSHRAEVMQSALFSRGTFDCRLPPGVALFTLVKNLGDGVRLRTFVPLLEHEDVNLPEQSCRALFETLAAQDPGLIEAEQRLRETGCCGWGQS
jgi:hypothetical protein